jgi:DNA-binding IclR family transcriptional regulator
MEKLRSECGEEISLYKIEGNRRVCVLRIESLHEIARVGTIGDYLPLHAGAAGRVLLAYLPENQCKKIISSLPLKQYTDLTLTDPEKLQETLKEIRKKGYCISRGEREPDAYSVVAPVWDSRNQVISSLSISGPNFRLTEEQLEINIRGVLSAAKEISEKLGFVE